MIPLHIIKTICKTFDITPDQIMEYPASPVKVEQGQLLMCKVKGVKNILAECAGDLFYELDGTVLSESLKLCPLTHQNRLVLNKYLPYTRPIAFGTQVATFGTGDRLGLASPAHIRSVKNSDAKPILAQQSKRELELTGRNYAQVLDDACFAVFQEGYLSGFGADGDHLKNAADIRDALACGYTMITLDCSKKIDNTASQLSADELSSVYQRLPAAYRARIEGAYLEKGAVKKFRIVENEYSFTEEELFRCALVYRGAIDFAGEIYRDLLTGAEQPVDFELSIDETESVTTVQAHLFTAMELIHQNIRITSLAPKFIGEFQKGIDYIGDIGIFEAQLARHAAIASHFGYKLSIHSGSDKFSVFPLIGKYTGGLLHLKTSGTSWLEAIGTIAACNPTLYRHIHECALAHFEEARRFYHVSADLSQIADLDHMEDDGLVKYLENDHSRQLLHITYGFILRDHSLKSEIYKTLEMYDEHFAQRLISHMDHHLVEIGLK